jgi:hypothetical protein
VAKSLWKIAVLVLLATALAAGWRLPAAHAVNPGTISFQGKIVNANGTNVADGTYSFVFKLYTVGSGGSALWTETDSLPVSAGVFQVNLGANSSLSGIDFSANSNLYLGITFNSDPAGEMTPRVQLQSVPFAFQADNASKLGGVAASNYAQLSGGQQTGSINVNGSGTFGGGLTVSTGSVKIGSFTSAGVVHSSAAGILSNSAVVLGTDTSGSYIANLGTLTGLTTSGNSGAGSTPTLSVQYGAAANTAVQGNISFTCTGASGSNLSGGGNTIVEGSGGSCTAISLSNSPSFSGLVTANGGLIATGSITSQTSSYTTSQVLVNDGQLTAPPAFPSSMMPALTVVTSETSGSRPLFFGYTTGSGYGAFLDGGACGSFTQMCLDLGSGTSYYTALENIGTTLSLGGGADGNFAALTVVPPASFSSTLSVSGLTTLSGGLTASGTISLGNGGTFSVSSNHVDISTAGAVSGVTTLTAQTINATSNFQANGQAGINESCPNNDFINVAVVNEGILTGDGGCQTRGLSDERLKTDIVSLSDNTLDQLAGVNPVNFYFDCSNNFFSSTHTVCDPNLQTGVVAQQLQSIFPQLVSQDEFGYYHVDYQGLSVEALKGVSQLAQHINSAGDANLNSIISSSLTSDGALSLDSGASGDVSIDTGSAANVNVGTGLAGAVNLSRTGQTTTVNGALLVDQAGDFAGDVTIGGNLTLSGSGFSLLGDNGQTVVSFDRSGNASFAGSLDLASASVSGGLTIGGDITVGGLSTFQKLATFLARTVFRQDVEFDGHIIVASDSAGYAALRSGESSVHVTFTASYDNPPVVTASIVNGQYSLVSVNNVTAQGFALSLSQPAAADTLLSWTALGVANPQTAANPISTP